MGVVAQRREGVSSHQFREDNSDKFRSLGNGKYGGFKSGIPNGPEASTARAKRRHAKRAGK